MGKMKDQLFEIPLHADPGAKIAFDGETYSPEIDYKRLRGQLERVFSLMQDGEYRTLSYIADECGGSVAGISARLRDLRKPQYGGYIVDKKRVPNKRGLWEYAIKTEVGSGRMK